MVISAHSNEMKGTVCSFLSPSPSASHEPHTSSSQQKCNVFTGNLCFWTYELYTVTESGGTLGISLQFLPPEDRLGFHTWISYGATALGKWARDLAKFSYSTNTENSSSSKGFALLPIWSLNMHGLILPPTKHLKMFQRGSGGLHRYPHPGGGLRAMATAKLSSPPFPAEMWDRSLAPWG